MDAKNRILTVSVFVLVILFSAVTLVKPEFVGFVVLRNSCSDSDGGKMINLLGVVSGNDNKMPYSLSDSCKDAQTLKEYYCSANAAKFYVVNCGNDYFSDNYCKDGSVYRDATRYSCVSGACLQTKGQEVVEVCKAGCTNALCNEIPDSCSDSDNGLVPEIAGAVSGFLNAVQFNNQDTCVDSGTLSEYYCIGPSATSNTISCGNSSYGKDFCLNSSVYRIIISPQCAAGACSKSNSTQFVKTCLAGCTNGVCDSTQLNSCTDTDNGINILIKGLVYGTYKNNPFMYNDSCSNNSTIKEYFCQSGLSAWTQLLCTNHTTICKNGKCI